MKDIKDFFSLRILTKLAALGAGFGVLLVAIIWTRASFAWGTDTNLQWVWFAFAIVSGVWSFVSAVGTVSNRALWTLVAVDALLISMIWWL